MKAKIQNILFFLIKKINFIIDSINLTKNKNNKITFKYIGEIPQESKLFYIFKKLIKGKDIFINIGAHHGFYSCYALKKNINTLIFEPNLNNLYFLYRNIEINKFKSKVNLFPISLSNQIGIKRLYGTGTGSSLNQGWGGAFFLI